MNNLSQMHITEIMTKNSEALVGIVILTHNQKEITLDCLSSLEKINYKNFFIILVDNASSDDTTSAVKDNFQNVIVIRNERNCGVAGGRNIGAKAAIEKGANFILFLDNDTFVKEDFLENLLTAAHQTPDFGAAGPKIFYTHERNLICHAIGVFYPLLCHNKSVGGFQVDNGQYNEIVNVDWISGCAGLFKTSVLIDVGLLDEQFTPYGPEDIDLSLRIRNKGYKLIFVPTSSVFHKKDPYEIVSDTKFRYMMRGRLLLSKKHSNSISKVISFAWLCFYILIYNPIIQYKHLKIFSSPIPGLLGLVDALKTRTINSFSRRNGT